MRQYDALQQMVGGWRQKNYNDNESPYFTLKMEPFPLDWKVGDAMPPTVVCMGSLLPLMGVTTALSVLADTRSDTDAKNALGEVFINLSDYATREGFVLPIGKHLTFPIEMANLDPLMGMLAYTGKLYECVQRRHQGTHGMSTDSEFVSHRKYCVAMMLLYMQIYADSHFKQKLLMVANRAWNVYLANRNWENGKGGNSTDAG